MKPASEVFSPGRLLPAEAKVSTYAEDQPQYTPLPCVRLPTGEVATKWELTDKERELINDSGCFYLVISTFNYPLQPLKPMADEPDIAADENGELFFYSPMAWRKEQGLPEPEDLYDSGLPAGFRDVIYTDTQIHFGFWDRVKVLFGWKVRLEAKTFTEKRPGNLRTESQIRVYRQKRLPKGWGVVEANLTEQDRQ